MIPLRRILQNVGSNVGKIPSRCFYEQTKEGKLQFQDKKIEMQRQASEIKLIKKKVQTLKHHMAVGLEQVKENTVRAFSVDNRTLPFEDQELVKFWDFNQANNGVLSSYAMHYKEDKLNDLNNFYATCDSDFDVGYSKAYLDTSPAGYALFHGYLDMTKPKDGKVTHTGYAYFGNYVNPRQELFDACTNELSDVTHVCLRVRGDGRKYHITFDTSGKMDITFFDRYNFYLYTHGGPYWQEVRIPLSRFFFQYQSAVQDEQTRLQPELIKSVGILAADNFSGPFRLEIDYIGFMKDSQWSDIVEYEGYYHESMTLKTLS